MTTWWMIRTTATLWRVVDSQPGSTGRSSPRRARSQASTERCRPESVKQAYSSTMRSTASPPEPTNGLQTYSDIQRNRVSSADARVQRPTMRSTPASTVSR